jgi:hypothetical protein
LSASTGFVQDEKVPSPRPYHKNVVIRLLPRVSLVLLLAALGACGKTHAKTPAIAGLDTPAPPDRVIVPIVLPEPIEPAPAPAAPAQPAPARPRENPPPRSVSPAPPPAVAPPQPAEQPAAAPPVLQTTTNPAQVANHAKSLIAAAQRDLDRLTPAQLTPNARAQYDTAKGFIRQAEDALKVNNVVLARELADKAAALASQLRR